MIAKNQSMVKKQNCVIWIHILYIVYIKADDIYRDIFIHWMVFKDICLEIYELHPAKFLSAPWFAWQAVLKKTNIKLHFIADIDMLLMIENVTEGIRYYIYWYAKANNKYMKHVNKSKKSSYIQ